jgi:hypothetical protein
MVTDLARGEYRTLTFANELLVQELIDIMFWLAERPWRTFKRAYVDLPEPDVAVLQALPIAGPDPDSVARAHLVVTREFLPRARVVLEQSVAAGPPSSRPRPTRISTANLGSESASRRSRSDCH